MVLWALLLLLYAECRLEQGLDFGMAESESLRSKSDKNGLDSPLSSKPRLEYYKFAV